VSAPNEAPARRTLTITLGGDLGLGSHAARVEPAGTRRHGTYLQWHELTAGIRPLLDGDLNFANLETVVTSSNALSPEAKTFVFRSHPDGVRHLASIGFNLLSTANNHAVDYGTAGMRETLRHLELLAADGRIVAHAGLGEASAAAARPRVFDRSGVRVAFSALGISTGGRAGEQRPGLMEWRVPSDVATVLSGLAAAAADVRILSVHHGEERSVATDSDAIRKLRHQAVLAGGIDIVAGHHAHVVQGIELTQGRLIFYGLGNLLHPGMQDMGRFDMCRDYGLLARVHLAGGPSGRLAVRAVEAIPLTDMHWRVRPMPSTRAAERIHVLNRLANPLDDTESGARGLRFAVRSDGTGLHCEPGADREPGRIGDLCRGWSGPSRTPVDLAARIASACSGRELVASAARPRPLAEPAFGLGAVPATRPAAPTAPRDTGWSRSVFAGN
jgi:poly-gamma-glutamate synthesis protein (capsule biosynthesis protein)